MLFATTFISQTFLLALFDWAWVLRKSLACIETKRQLPTDHFSAFASLSKETPFPSLPRVSGIRRRYIKKFIIGPELKLDSSAH